MSVFLKTQEKKQRQKWSGSELTNFCYMFFERIKIAAGGRQYSGTRTFMVIKINGGKEARETRLTGANESGVCFAG